MNHRLEKEVNQLVEAIIEDYDKGRDIDDVIENFTNPNKDDIIKILDQLRNVIFPGYYKNKSYHVYTVRNNLSMQLEDVLYNLSKQISRVLKYLPKYAGWEERELLREGEKLSLQFLGKITQIRALIQTDLQAAYDGDPAAFNKPEIIFSYPGLYAIMVNRIAHELYLLGIPLIPRMMTEYAHTQTGIDIHPGAVLGKYFFIDHGTGIVIGETAIIGDYVKIYQGVTVGALSTRGGQKLNGKKRHPTIEDNVTIYAGASILGGDTVIGHDSVIGGNAFITTSIPPNTRVSIKNQELEYKQGKGNNKEINQSEEWYYII
ncbi:MAG: serine O-acetyltransferase EpsC [Lachnospiraceae bacterium]|nr:serine acetyltransferase [Lachnospiraceae bacterium]MDD6619102.1 serine acetyltransferase [Clostridiales bacterium]MDY4771436.1 serine O-acetyltransferase EpsC [Lachnospiraceae bacterium]